MYGNDEKSSTASNLLVLGTRLDRKTIDVIAFMLIMTIPAGFARYDLFDVSSFFFIDCVHHSSPSALCRVNFQDCRIAGDSYIYIYHLFPPGQEGSLFPL
jgi:hypothetical protein